MSKIEIPELTSERKLLGHLSHIFEEIDELYEIFRKSERDIECYYKSYNLIYQISKRKEILSKILNDECLEDNFKYLFKRNRETG